MQFHSYATLFASALVIAGCGDVGEDATAGQNTEAQLVNAAEQALTQACSSSTSHLDCNFGCVCANGACELGPGPHFGPIPPPEFCTQPPQRACTTAASCRGGCTCSGGYCEPDGFSPPAPDCHLPPPDAYESDNLDSQASYYLGVPQTGRTFHELGDVDWVLVYFANAAQASFETYDLVGRADTSLQVYQADVTTGSLGALADSSSTTCTAVPVSCTPAKVTLNVPADSAYFIRVENKNETSHNVYNQEDPGYSFRIY
jgi:hypothetical protein